MIWELDHKEGWVPKNCCFWTVMVEKILESPLDCKEIKPVNPKGNQPWIFIGKTDAEAETPTFWPPDTKSLLIGKDSDAGKDWMQKEEGAPEDKRWDGITDSMDMNLNKVWEIVKNRGAWLAAAHGVAKSQTWRSNWTTTMTYHCRGNGGGGNWGSSVPKRDHSSAPPLLTLHRPLSPSFFYIQSRGHSSSHTSSKTKKKVT